MTDVSAQYRGSIPEFYHTHLGPVMFEPYAAHLAQRFHVPEGSTVMELACGTGILTRKLRDRLSPTTRLIATDLNEPMLERAKAQLGEAEKMQWQQVDATALPFANAVFAGVACAFGLMFFPDKAAAISEARRVLIPNGLLALSVWDTLERNPYARLAQEIIERRVPQNPPQFFHVPFGYNDVTVLQQLLSTNGFERVEIQQVSFEACSISAHSFANGLIEGYPISLALAERGIALKPVVNDLAAALIQLGGERPFKSSMSALLVTARAATK